MKNKKGKEQRKATKLAHKRDLLDRCKKRLVVLNDYIERKGEFFQEQRDIEAAPLEKRLDMINKEWQAKYQDAIKEQGTERQNLLIRQSRLTAQVAELAVSELDGTEPDPEAVKDSDADTELDSGLLALDELDLAVQEEK